MRQKELHRGGKSRYSSFWKPLKGKGGKLKGGPDEGEKELVKVLKKKKIDSDFRASLQNQ